MIKEKTKLLGSLLFICGIGLFVWALNLHGAFKNEFVGATGIPPSTATMLLFFCGAFCTGFGLYKLAKI